MRSSPFTNQQLYDFIRENPGGIQNFLMQFSIVQLQQTIKRKKDLEDERVRNNRSVNLYKTNVLDMNLKDIIHRCKAENLINYFNWKLQNQNSRLQNHSKFGRMLVNNIPEKYYIGQKSNHFNHARQIQESYGIYNYNQQDQSDQQSQNQQNNDDNNDQNQQERERFEYNSDQDLDDFVVDDDQVSQSYLSQKEFKQKKNNKKKTKTIKKNQKQSKILSKNQKDHKKQELKKQSDNDQIEQQEQENLGQYIIKNTFQVSSPYKMQCPQTMLNIQVSITRKSNKKFIIDSDQQQ